MHGFFWLIDGALAGCPRPGSPAAGGRQFVQPPTTRSTSALDDDLTWLRGQGIGALLSLTETPLPVAAGERRGLVVAHLPIPDQRAPSPWQFEQALAFIDQRRARGQAVAVHCLMGQGRTGTILASYLIRGGQPVVAALAELRARCPGAISSREQEAALHAFAARRDWLV